MDLSALTTILNLIPNFYETYKNRTENKKLEFNKAVELLSKAILETKSYSRNGFNNRIESKEIQIRNYYLSLRDINSDLASRCFSKAEYWSNPNTWSNNKIIEYNITLDSLTEALKALK